MTTIVRCPECRRHIATVQEDGNIYIQIHKLRLWLEPTAIVRCYCPSCHTAFDRSEAVYSAVANNEQTVERVG